jgi:hypothetical protein
MAKQLLDFKIDKLQRIQLNTHKDMIDRENNLYLLEKVIEYAEMRIKRL